VHAMVARLCERVGYAGDLVSANASSTSSAKGGSKSSKGSGMPLTVDNIMLLD